MDADYALREPEHTYEVSATRLSNEPYRNPEPDGQAVEKGVTVDGPEGISAVLDGASRSYVLTVAESGDRADMEKAFQRIYGSSLPEGTLLYDMQLTDNSNIPIKKLGRQMLSVAFPVPDSLKGREVRIFGLDRNGQLEEIPSILAAEDGVETLRFSTNSLSQICFCPTGALAGELVEVSAEMPEAEAAPIQTSGFAPHKPVQYGIAAALMGGGILLFVLSWKGPRSRAEEPKPQADVRRKG